MKILISHKYSSCKWTLLKRFSRSQVKEQGRDKTIYNGGVIHNDGVSLRVTCL